MGAESYNIPLVDENLGITVLIIVNKLPAVYYFTKDRLIAEEKPPRALVWCILIFQVTLEEVFYIQEMWVPAS